MQRMTRNVLVVAMLLMVGMALAETRGPDTGDLPQGGMLQIPVVTDPTSLNPAMRGELAAATVNWTMFSPLTSVNPWTNDLEPHLAHSWYPNDDLTVWTFELRPDVRWHDGVAFSAHDVKFTFDRIRDPDEALGTLPDFSKVTDIEVPDELTVIVTLSGADAFFADRLALGGNEIVPEHILGEFERLADATEFNTTRPIGTGPFKMKTVAWGSYFELEANDDYFQGRPNLDGIIFRVVPDGNTRVTQLLTGQLDLAELEPNQLPVVTGNPRLVAETFDSLGYRLFAWNLLNPLFQDVRVRQAFMHAIDRRQILQSVAPGMGYLGDTYLPAALTWIPQADVAFREYDPERALELMAEAGWEPDAGGVLRRDGEPFEFYILVDRGDVQHEQMGLIIQQYLQDIGMRVEYVLAERGGRWLDESQQRTFPTRLAAFPMTNIDWVQRLYTCDGANNSQSYCNPAVDALITQLRTTADREEQGEILRQVQVELYEDPPNMVLFFRQRINGYNAMLGNMPPFSIKDAMPYSHLFYLNR
jgi:peptide/nickel transport system substrate-binding protein